MHSQINYTVVVVQIRLTSLRLESKPSLISLMVFEDVKRHVY